MATAQPAAAAAPKALINGDTVSGSPSLEQQQAEALGFSVNVVTGAQWDAMTQSQFATYQVLIIGDPTCSFLAASATSNASTWAPVVMGKAVHSQPGNRTLVGTDPVFHHFSHSGATKLIKDGISFSGALSGRTGVYFDMSCGDNGQGLATLNMLSVGAGTWTENTTPPCGGSVAKIASNPAFDDLHSSDLQGWSCSDHETFPTFRDDWSALAVATDTPTHPVCGNDADTGTPQCGEPYILVAGVGVAVSSPDISLTPKTSTNPVGTDHKVTATVTSKGSPSPGQLVSFTVTGVNNGATGTCVPADCKTDANGHVSFTYHDSKGAGDDTITASFTDASGTKEQASATKHWGGSTSSDEPISASGTTVHATEGAAFSGTVATFSDPDASATASEYSANITWGDGSPATAGTISGPTGGPFTVHGTHTYGEEGTFAVTVTVTDKDTTSNHDTAHSTAKVADAPITAKCAAPSTSQQSFSGAVASLNDADPHGTKSDYTATINWGDGSTSGGTVAGPDGGPFTINGSHSYATTGSFTIKINAADAGGAKSATSCSVLVYAFAPGGGSFAIGDRDAAKGSTVTFWGSQWWKRNAMSSRSAPASFKGFADQPATPTCGGTWQSGPGDSSKPPSGPLPTYMAVIVTSSASQSRSTISGNIVSIVIIKTDAGYAPDPGHPGTGTVVGRVC